MNSSVKDFYHSVPLGVCVIHRRRGKPMDILYSNPAFAALTGATGNGPIERAWPTPAVEKLAKKLKSPTPPRSWTLPVADEAGRWVTMTIEDSTFEGEPCFVLWATDISYAKESEAQLRQAVQEADALAQMKSNFLATMSHEIRTPMQAIYGLLELISEEKPDERVSDMVDIARNAASGLLEILDDVLDFASIDADKLAGGSLEAITVKARGKDVKLVGDIAPTVPPVVVGDPKRLRQILMNLMSNALKFTLNGSVTLRVTRDCQHIHPANGIALRFEVVDTGIGIAPDVAKRLFSPFTQADNSTSRRFGGTGLGLSICKKLVTHMGGMIGIESTEGRGSTFWFEIPTEEVSAQDSTTNLPSLEGISILSVEDHPQGSREIKRSLESMGASVESCPTSAEGLELAKRRPFDVALIDQGLPDGLGIDLVRELIALRPFMGLIMYTVRDDIGLQHSLNAMGIQYLAKPASRLGLGEAVKDAARKHEATNTGGPSRLLIAEDTASVRDVLRRQLDRLGVDADFVENGVQAWEALKTGQYGILFTDLHMPEMDGYALVTRIRKDETPAKKHFPVVVLTADVQMAQRHVYLGHGFDECLLKPVSLGQFRRLLIRWGLLKDNAPNVEGTTKAETVSTNDAVDRNAIRQQMGALDAGSIEMLHMFIGMTEPLLQKLDDALAAGDFHALEETGHSLKGAAHSACCPHLGDLAGKIQDDAHELKDCRATITSIHKEFIRVREEIAALKPD
jgi:signal transduction histidine kinase/CheY-like chemotaxis protein